MIEASAGAEMPTIVRGRASVPSRVRTAFRLWRRSRPFWAGLWAMLAGAVITYVPSTGFKFLFTGVALWAGILVGILVGTFGLFLWIQPQFRYLLGTLIIIFSMISFVTSDFGGLFVGMFAGVLGGSMSLAWLPVPVKARERRWLKRRVVPTAITLEEVVPQLVILEPAEGIAVSYGPDEALIDAPEAEMPEVIELPEVIEVEPALAPALIDLTDTTETVDLSQAEKTEHETRVIDLSEADTTELGERMIDLSQAEFVEDEAKEEPADKAEDVRPTSQ